MPKCHIHECVDRLPMPSWRTLPLPLQLHEVVAWYWHVAARTMVGLLSGERAPVRQWEHQREGAPAIQASSLISSR